MAIINGTDNADALTGTAAADQFSAGKGNDVLISGGGFDTMAGGEGDDTYLVDGQVVIDEQPDSFEKKYGVDTVLVSGDRFELAEYSTYNSFMAVEDLRASDPTRTKGITLIGNSYAQSISGGAGNDVMDTGLTGTSFDLSAYPNYREVMSGFGGNDYYTVRGSTTLVVEAVGGGRDTIAIDTQFQTTGGSYELYSNSEVEEIRIFGSLPIDVVGNRFDQLIVGNDYGSVLNGGGGADTLVGMLGDDTYLVDNTRDVVIEGVDGGSDIVYTTASYNLGDNSIEVLSTVNHSATDAINLIGNFVSQTVIGNYGANILNGGSGVDTLIGLRGDDLYAVGDSRIKIQEAAGEGTDTVVTSADYTLGAGVSVEVLAAQDRASLFGLRLTGNEQNQTIAGTFRSDTLNGGAGSDVLIGNFGRDRFDFTTALGPDNVDTITILVPESDRIGLSSSIFSAVGATLDPNEFVLGATAGDADDRIIYNPQTGQLSYDADGTGASSAIVFALLPLISRLTSADFDVIGPA